MEADDIDIKKIRRENSGKRKKIASENTQHDAASHYTDNPVIISAKDITKSFRMGRTNLRVLKGVDVQVHRGQFMAITGSSGSGKSTLLHLLGGLDRPDTGMVEFNGCNIADYSAGKLNKYRNKNVGFVFQFYHLLDELTVLENILLPVMASAGTIAWLAKSSKAKKAAMDLLELVGLADRAKQKSYQLSGGERQRVAIARALINKPDIILADEPTGNLDSKTGNGILNLFEDLNRAGQTIIMVTHDELIAHRTHNVVKLVDGKIE
jgi:ABC-type lipoprotein export system ATPase subunit